MTDTGRTSSTRGAAAKSKQADRRARQARQGGGIDDPAPRRGLRLRNPLSGDMFGRGAEAFARFMGTPAFLVGMTVFCAVWLGWNTFMPESIQFDPRALNFTLLTLILSLQASYAAPLLLLSDNRQADRDRVQAEQDRQSTERNHATTDFITREIATLRLALNEVATRDFVRGELRDLLEEIQAEDDDAERPAAVRPSDAHGVGAPGDGAPAASGTAAPAASGTAASAPGIDPEALRALLREEIAAALREQTPPRHAPGTPLTTPKGADAP